MELETFAKSSIFLGLPRLEAGKTVSAKPISSIVFSPRLALSCPKFKGRLGKFNASS